MEKSKLEIRIRIGQLAILNLLSLITVWSPLGRPLEPEVCSAVISGLPAGQHHPGLHQDIEEELVLNRLRGPDDAAVQRYRDILYTNILYTWQSLYELSLYRTDFIRDKVYTGQSLYGDKIYTRTKFIRGQSLYGTKFIRWQSLYGDKVYTRTKFIQTFFILYT